MGVAGPGFPRVFEWPPSRSIDQPNLNKKKKFTHSATTTAFIRMFDDDDDNNGHETIFAIYK